MNRVSSSRSPVDEHGQLLTLFLRMFCASVDYIRGFCVRDAHIMCKNTLWRETSTQKGQGLRQTMEAKTKKAKRITIFVIVEPKFDGESIK